MVIGKKVQKGGKSKFKVCKKRCENSGKYGTISQGALRELYLRGGGLLCVQDMVHTQGTPECTQKQFADSKEGHFC